MQTLQDFLQSLSTAFTSKTRPSGESFIVLKEDHPLYEQAKDIVYACHDGLLPNDLIYDVVDSLISNLASDCCEDTTNINDVECEGEIYIKDHDFRSFNWYAHHMGQALEEMGGYCANFDTLECAGKYDLILDLLATVRSEIASLADEDYTTEAE